MNKKINRVALKELVEERSILLFTGNGLEIHIKQQKDKAEPKMILSFSIINNGPVREITMDELQPIQADSASTLKLDKKQYRCFSSNSTEGVKKIPYFEGRKRDLIPNKNSLSSTI